MFTLTLVIPFLVSGAAFLFFQPAPDRQQNGVFTNLKDVSPYRRSLLLGLAAVFSAVLSFLAQHDHPLNIVVPAFFSANRYSLNPGFYFGAVLGVAFYLFVKKQLSSCATIIAMTVIAWMAAMETFHFFYDGLGLQENATPGFCAGVVGAGITIFGITIWCRNFRRPQHWIRTILLGGFAGLIALSGDFLSIFLLWQPLVAASIGFGLDRSEK